MNTKSISFRLTLWYSLAFFIGAAVLLVSFYLLNKRILFSQTDQIITSHSEALVQIVTAGPQDSMTGAFNHGIITAQFAEMPGMFVLITDPVGNIVASSHPDSDSSPIVSDLIKQSVNLIKPTFVERRIGANTLRLGIFPISPTGGQGLVIMGDPVEAIYHSLNNLLLVTLFIYLLLAIPLVGGSYLLAKSALSPVVKIADELKTISEQNLDKQVVVPYTGDEIADLARTFNDLLKRLHDSFSRERQFIGDIAHELKTPIATMMGETELALSKNRSAAEYQKSLKENLVDMNKLTRILKNVLDMAWLASDKANIASQKFDLSKSLINIGETIRKMAALKNLDFETKIMDEVFVSGSEEQISRAIFNILDNAVKYTQEGKVSLTFSKTQKQARVEIVDTGVGIAKKDLPHIFDRFYRGNSNFSGSGLGLSIAKGIIETYKGEIRVYSKVNQGTKFVVTLPLHTPGV